VLAEIVRAADVAAPVTERPSVAEVFVSNTVPPTVPAALGEKTTLNMAVLFGPKVRGRDKPVTLKPPLGTLIAEIVRFAAPEFFSSTGWETLAPTGALTHTHAGVAPSADRIPVPISDNAAVLFDALL
jgi:hypothetical protein